MNREIKFRGIRPHDGKWLYGSLLTGLFHNTVTKEDSCNILDTDEHRDFDCFQDLDDIETDVITSTVGQYTGLKDKNGKEIYEGDILDCITKNSQFTLEVKFGHACFVGETLFTKHKLIDFFNALDFESWEVYGNIHQK